MPRLVPAVRRIALLCVAAAALVAAVAPAANAKCDEIRWQVRWQPDPFGTSGGSLIRVPVCVSDDAPRTKPKRGNAESKQPTRAQLRALRYRSSDAVSATVRQRMVEQLAHGADAERIRTTIESGDLMRQFGAAMRTQGWSTRDLGDMYALAYLQLWLVANDKRTTSAAVDKAVRKDLRDQLALDRKVRAAGDASQQETAEWLGSWTVVLAGSINHLRTLGDPARVEEYRQHARELIRSPDLLGVDLTRVKLTRRGIAER